MRPALHSFLFVLGAFALLSTFPLFGGIGFALAGEAGAVVGCTAALFFTCWMVCWAIAAA